MRCDNQDQVTLVEWNTNQGIFTFVRNQLREYRAKFLSADYIEWKKKGSKAIYQIVKWNKIQFSSVAQPCLTLCDPMDCSMPGLPVHHQFLEFTQTHVLPVGDAIQPSPPLSSPSPPAFNLSHHQGLFQWISSSHQVAKYWTFSFRISPSNKIFRTNFL